MWSGVTLGKQGLVFVILGTPLFELLWFLEQHKMVNVVFTTSICVKEEIIKCMDQMFLGDFKLNDIELQKNRE